MNYKSLPDQDLVSLFISGNDYAFEVLLNRYKQQAYINIHCYVRNKYLAEEILQETTIKVANYIRNNKYIESGKFLALMNRVSYNVLVDHHRINKKKQSFIDLFSTETLNRIIEQATDTDFAETMKVEQTFIDLIDATKKLNTDQQQIIHMHYFENLKFKEIAEKLGISVNTALGRSRYAIQQMLKICEKDKIFVEN